MPDYSASNKRIVKNTIYLYIRMFIVLVVSLYTVRVILNALGVEDYGIHSAVGGVVTSLSFITAVLSTASQRFFSVAIAKDDEGYMGRIVSTLFITYIAISILIILFVETVGIWFVLNKMTIPEGRESAAVAVLQFALASFVVSLLSNPFQALIISHEDMKIYAYMSIIEVVLKLLTAFFITVTVFDKLKVYSFLIFFIGLITAFCYFLYCRKKYQALKGKLTFDKKEFKPIFSFSSWTLFGSLAFMLNSQGINIILNIFFGPVVNAAYAIGNQIKTYVNQFSSNFFSAVRPAMVKTYTQGDKDHLQQMCFYSSKIIYGLLIIIITPIFVETENILLFWLGEIKPYMSQFVRLMLVYCLILSMNDPLTAIAQASGKVKIYHGIVDGFTILTLPITYGLYKLGYPPAAAFYVSIIIFIIAHVIRLIIVKRIAVFSIAGYTYKVICPILLSLLPIVGVGALLHLYLNSSDIEQVLISCLLSCAVAALSVLFIVLSKEERQKFFGLIYNKFRRK